MTMGNLSHLASYAPSAYDLLYRLGLERRRSRSLRAASAMGWMGFGMAVGSGLALLFNPRSGPEVRERLSERVKRAREYVAPHEEDEAGQRASSSPGAASSARTTPRRT